MDVCVAEAGNPRSAAQRLLSKKCWLRSRMCSCYFCEHLGEPSVWQQMDVKFNGCGRTCVCVCVCVCCKSMEPTVVVCVKAHVCCRKQENLAIVAVRTHMCFSEEGNTSLAHRLLSKNFMLSVPELGCCCCEHTHTCLLQKAGGVGSAERLAADGC